jgi:uncharacterized protein YndB with AHSA1/START domain
MGSNSEIKPVGLTKNSGFEIGLRKTFPIPPDFAWKFLLSPDGLHLWLGAPSDFHPEKGMEYRTSNGVTGVVNVLNPGVNIRLTWQPEAWSKPSTLQIRVIPASGKATISIHQENLPDNTAREEMRSHWQGVMEKISQKLNGQSG